MTWTRRLFAAATLLAACAMFTFPKPGVYTYVCVLHAAEGMTGKVIVTAAGTPASLPKTGEAAPGALLLPLAAGALLFVLLGTLLVRRQAW